ncbi:MAG: exopolysaccharide transport family protein [Hyphomicrobium sp.]
MVQIVPRLGPIPFPRAARLTAMAAASNTTSNTGANASVRPTHARQTGSTDLGGLLQILRRNLWKILLATLAGLALSLTYLALAKPSYTATASLFVDPRTKKIVSEEIVQGGVGSDLALVESQVSILTSDAVLGRVVEKLKLADDVEYAPPPGGGLLSKIKGLIIAPSANRNPTVQAISTLADSIKVKRAQKTYVVEVDVTASSPVRAQSVAQAVVDAYLADQTAAKTSEAKRANGLIDARLGELREQVRRAETRVDDFKKANKILTSEGGIVNEQQLSKLNSELITTRAVAAESKARQDQILVALKTSPGAEVLPDAVRSGLVQKLREQYSQVARREAALSSQLQPRHPVLMEVRSQLTEVKAQINAELKRVATAAQAEYQIASSRERDISAQLERAKEEVTRTNTAQIKLRELDQEVTASRELLRLFLGRAKETQEQQNVSTPDARVITYPSVPAKPSKPITWLVLALGLIGGLGLGLASALIGDHLDASLRTPNDFVPHLASHTIATIPALDGAQRHADSGWRSRHGPQRIEAAQFSDLLTALADYKNTDDVHYRQSVLRLLARIKSQQRAGRPHTVLFASPSAEAGNSATTLALAYAAAISGERVLLVDATSSNPSLSNIFATTLKPTNVVVLDNKDHLADITTRDARTGLTFLPIALADLRTLKNQQRRRLIAGLNGLIQRYDLIFIDAGALLEDESALCLLPAADQVLLVARSGVTTRGEITETMDVLEPARDRLTGGVLTMTT